MKNHLLSFIFSAGLMFFFAAGRAYSDRLEVNLAAKTVKLKDFGLEGYNITGEFDYKIEEEEDGLILFLTGRRISIGSFDIKEADIKISRKGDVVFIDKFDSDKFFGEGRIELDKKKFLFKVRGNWQEDSPYLQGEVDLRTKIWGTFGDFLVSGNFTVSEGIYEGFAFQQLRCSFFGTPPVFNLTDAEVLLYDGSIFELKGELDIRDPEDFFPGAEFVSQKLFVDGWQIFAVEKEEVGLRKDIDERLKIKVDAEGREERGTELRYNLENNNFLKLRMQEEETILGIERKKEF